MGRRKKENPLDQLVIRGLDIDPDIKKTIWALLILALAVIAGLGLFEVAGVIGGYINQASTWTFGWGRWIVPCLFLIWSLFIFLRERFEIRGVNYVGLFLFWLSIHTFLQLIVGQESWREALQTGAGGGHLGYWLAQGLVKGVGLIAAYVIDIILLLIAFMFMFNTTLANLWAKGSTPARFLMNPLGWWRNRRQADEDETEDEEEDEDEDEAENEDEEASEEGEASEDEEEEESDEEEEETMPSPVPVAATKNGEAVSNPWQPTGIEINLPIDLLSSKSGKARGVNIKANTGVIQKTLEEFGILVEMGDVSVGPTVTQYTLRPADGIKLSRITNLNNDLAMALAAHPIRIEAPIPGKSLVGIEVPNKAVALVTLRQVLESKSFANRKVNSTIALGKDVAGKVWTADLTKMPHLLVAGATGSGKSVMLNSLIVSLLYQNNPDDLRFIMVDPKRVELTVYNNIPHLLTPVITDVSKTVNALKWSLNEMDRRFKLLSHLGKRDIISYNKSSRQKLPYIIFVIDELADLMLLAGKEVEAGIVRLAQMSRAVGIHLVLATQRPSVNVITGTIKANMPARVAFAVASGIDSRTILDSLGAEKLLGKGDMLFSDASMPKPKRLQGCFLDDKEIKRVVKEIKNQAGKPKYLDDVTERQRVSGAAGAGFESGGDDEDELVGQAKEIVVQAGKASATLLQRKLSIGYARAAKILDILEEHGIVGEAQGSKPREVLITKEQFAQLMAGGIMSAAALHNRDEAVAPEEYLHSDDDYEDEEADDVDEADEPDDEAEDSAEEDEEDEDDEEEADDEDEAQADEEPEDDPDDEEEAEVEEEVESEDEGDEEGSAEDAPATEESDEAADEDDDDDFDKYFSR